MNSSGCFQRANGGESGKQGGLWGLPAWLDSETLGPRSGRRRKVAGVGKGVMAQVGSGS